MGAELTDHPLRKLRELHGLTMTEMGELLGVSRARVSVIESTDMSRLLVRTILRYVRAFEGELRMEVVFDEDEPHFPLEVDKPS